MKKNIHPKYNTNAVVTCNSCSITFETGSTLEEFRVEICSNCHPFYTGKAKIVDTENLVKKFNERETQAQKQKVIDKKAKQIQRSQKTKEIKATGEITLNDMLKQLG